MNQLQMEVIRIVQRIQAKNDIIASLEKELQEHKVREENLKKELKRVLRASTATAALAKEKSGAEMGRSTIKKQIPLDQQKLTEPTTPTKSPAKLKKALSPIKTPMKSKDLVSPRLTPVRSPVFSGPIHTPTSAIRPLQPSRREIAKPRYSPPFLSPAGHAQVKSPTGVVDAE
jgi:hypothetical protein